MVQIFILGFFFFTQIVVKVAEFSLLILSLLQKIWLWCFVISSWETCMLLKSFLLTSGVGVLHDVLELIFTLKNHNIQVLKKPKYPFILGCHSITSFIEKLHWKNQYHSLFTRCSCFLCLQQNSTVDPPFGISITLHSRKMLVEIQPTGSLWN